MQLFKTNQIRFGGIVMLLTILFLSLNCPHLSLATDLHCNCCVIELERHDLCNCPATAVPHEHTLHQTHAHEFWTDTSKTTLFNLILFNHTARVSWLHSEDDVRPIRFSLSDISRYSFAVRHLDTIILRV